MTTPSRLALWLGAVGGALALAGCGSPAVATPTTVTAAPLAVPLAVATAVPTAAAPPYVCVMSYTLDHGMYLIVTPEDHLVCDEVAVGTNGTNENESVAALNARYAADSALITPYTQVCTAKDGSSGWAPVDEPTAVIYARAHCKVVDARP